VSPERQVARWSLRAIAEIAFRFFAKAAASCNTLGNPQRKVGLPVPKCKATMKLNRKPVFWGALVALLLVSTCSSALTLGRVRGAAILGKPLDLSVLVQSSAEDDVTPNCFEADVHYGDNPIERSRVVISVQPGAQPDTQVVRVSSNASIDEALVRLTLRSVCSPKASRQYTLLADVVSEMAGAATSTPKSSVRSEPAGIQPVIAPAAASPIAAASNPLVGLPVNAKTHAKAPLKPVATAVLKLSQPTAKANNTINAAVLEDLQRRVDEIAKWQAGSTSAEDTLKSEARAKALESDILGLKAVTAKNQQNIQMVAAAVESSTSQSYDRNLIYGLGALLLACIAALAYVVLRLRSGGFSSAPWWFAEAGHQEVAVPVVPARSTTPGSLAGANPSVAAALHSAPTSLGERVPTAPVAIESIEGKPGTATEGMGIVAAVPVPASIHHPTPAGRPVRPDFAPSAPGNMKSINTREMLDVRQQAEFFMALGQHDEAVRLLESSIRGSADSNPLVLLDLLKILHTLSRRSDFERYREEFNAQFTGRIPSYANFQMEGNGLDTYEEICHQIVVLWPTEYTIDYIEQCLVRMPEDDPEQGIDLEAFKDLLLLYGVLKRLDQGYDSDLAPFSASRPDQHALSQSASMNAGLTAPLPVSAGGYGAATTPMDLDLDLDLDLNLDVGADAPKAVEQNNLIDFDMSAYMADKKPK